jgi:cell envelope opacity-associated protein A
LAGQYDATVRSRVLGATVALAVLLVVIAACQNEDPDVAADQTLPAIQTTSTVPTTLLTTTTQPRFYEVQPGDTLFDIAKAHGLPVEAIMQANGMTDANVLLAGQVIQLPLATEYTTTTLPRPTTIPPSTALPLVPTLAP